ncbi:Type 1 glutamine amidotransferase-like domain-containing protein [Nocardioides sp.]|uniref:Type 1 glutamine amidotransferase-like domain-containing protein n=1 Tax=Nocardioides sp. TaxID=35761 RepID=UPI003517DA7B
MKLLLTSGGVSNEALRAELVGLLGRPIEEATAVCIPTAMYGHPYAGPGERVWEFVAGRSAQPMVDLGWRSVSLLELTALPSIGGERWRELVRLADALLVSGGDALYLAHWMRESGLLDLVPELGDTVWVGMSAGSMVLTPRIGPEFVGWEPPGGGDAALGLVDFCLFPHLDHPDLTENTRAAAEEWAAGLGHPAYGLDDDGAVVVDGDDVRVVSTGTWCRFG